jgi:hypothetical protein
MRAGINAFTVSVPYSALTLNPSPITRSSQGEGLVFVPLRPLWEKGLGDEEVFAPKPEYTQTPSSQNSFLPPSEVQA